uniref:Integrase core domain containing protein n=1 Tax=Solanum tuberosum TaxID=4113 RepID=M1DTN4_SOLTU
MFGSESAQASGSESSNLSGHASRSESAQVSGSESAHAAEFGDNEQAASSDEATRLEPVPAPWNDDPILAELTSLRTDVDAILAAPSVEPQVAPTALADDTVLDALFSGTAEEGLAPTHAKRQAAPFSSH